MALFCGTIDLASGPAPRDAEFLQTMAAPLKGKGVGDLERHAAPGLLAATKRLTHDCPDATSARVHIEQSGGISCVGSVRIDNRREVATTLGLPDPGEDRRGDLALAAAAYRHWGTACAAHLYGDFAFVIWDASSKQALCVRDHIGAEPFFFSVTHDRLVFGNDLSCVAATIDLERDMDRRLVAEYLDAEVILPPGRTFLKSVARLKAGHQLLFSGQGAAETRWWDIEHIPLVVLPTDTDYIDRLDELLSKAVLNRMPRAGAVATHVTGGIDSSCVSALLVEHCRAMDRALPHAMTWNPAPTTEAEAELPEAKVLAMFCDAMGLRIERVMTDTEGLLEFFARDPLIHPTSAMLTLEIPLQRAAQAQGCTTIFSGHGGDQGISYRMNHQLPALLLSRKWAYLRDVGKRRNKGFAMTLLWASYALLIASLVSLRNRLPFVLTKPEGSFKRPSFYRFNPRNKLARVIGPTVLAVRRGFLLDGYLEMRMDAWAEHGSRRGIRYAYPLLDRAVLEFTLGLPREMFLRDGTNRWLIRQFLRRHAPEAVAENIDKTEPTRVRTMGAAIARAQFDILDALSETQPRADIVDVARLKAALAQEPSLTDAAKIPKFGRRRAALELLSFERKR